MQHLWEVIPLVGSGKRFINGGESHCQAEKGEVVQGVDLIAEADGHGANVAVGVVFGDGAAGGCGVEPRCAVLTE